MGKFLFPILARRPGWHKMPTKVLIEADGDAAAVWGPVGYATVDYADLASFSTVENTIEGGAWIDNKAHLYAACPSYLPRTYVVRDGAWDPAHGVPHLGESPGVWFLKEVHANYATGVDTFADPAACLANAEKDKVIVETTSSCSLSNMILT